MSTSIERRDGRMAVAGALLAIAGVRPSLLS